jgi:hypothetical protein
LRHVSGIANWCDVSGTDLIGSIPSESSCFNPTSRLAATKENPTWVTGASRASSKARHRDLGLEHPPDLRPQAPARTQARHLAPVMLLKPPPSSPATFSPWSPSDSRPCMSDGPSRLLGTHQRPSPPSSCTDEGGALRSERVMLSRPSSLLRPLRLPLGHQLLAA